MLHMIHDTTRAGLPEAPAAPGRGRACEACRGRGISGCACVLGAVIDQSGGGPLEFDAQERAAIEALAGAGLLPPLWPAPVRAA